MCLDKGLVVEWVSYFSAYFTVIAHSHNFDKAFLVKLGICHLHNTQAQMCYVHALFDQAYSVLKQKRKCFFFFDGSLIVCCEPVVKRKTAVQVENSTSKNNL